MTKHRFLNEGRSPIPMGSDAKFACACGRTGTRSAIEQHIAERAEAARMEADRQERQEAWSTITSHAVPADDYGGGGTKANYLPMQPRQPASPTFSDLPTPPELPPPPASTPDRCPTCQEGLPIADLPEIAAWSCGHWLRKASRPIAEAFQDMLRRAFHAGVAAVVSDETFEDWYQREVMQ